MEPSSSLVSELFMVLASAQMCQGLPLISPLDDV